MQLNPAQERAVLHTEGPLVVFAGAGSGKTRVITYRIANLIANRSVPPYRILAVTFTNKAAKEMRDRLVELAGESIAADLWVGTFHSVCCRLLRRYHDEVGLGRNFVIYDDSDQKSLMTRIIRARKLDERVVVPKQVLGQVHRWKQEGLSPADVPKGPRVDETERELYEAYEQALLTANAVDFDDLILHVLRLAEHPTSRAGAELRDRFDYLLVDEFQDTNTIQYRLVRALAHKRKNLCVVGDDDQSIYSWRGADVRNIRGFRRDFADAQIVKLEQNYRSSGNIVAAALGVISSAPDREPKRLWTSAQGGEQILLVSVDDERAEAQYVARSAAEAITQGTPADQIAVFYRINAQSRVLEEAFRAAGIPYQIVGGMRFFERAEVKDALAYLRVVENPRSDADLLRVINVPTRGIGGKTIQHLLDLSHQRGLSVWTALGEAIAEPGLGVSARKKLQAFKQLMDDLMATSGATPRELAERVLEETGYRAALRAADNAEADARLENLAEFVGSIAEYQEEAEREGQVPSVAGYLERVSLVSDIDGVADERAVLLMTVHAAKGLEFDSVFLTGMEEEMFPYRGMDGTSPDELEEERRLAYVAITRARRKLVVSRASVRTIFGFTRYARPSRFLNDLPAEVTRAVEIGWSARSAASRPAPVPSFRPRRSYDEFDQSVPAPDVDDRYFTSPRRDAVSSAVEGTRRDVGRERDAAVGEHAADTQRVDYTAFDDVAPRAASVRRGSRVFHERFGRGTVESVTDGEPPKVVARFPGWGERRVLLTKLRLQ